MPRQLQVTETRAEAINSAWPSLHSVLPRCVQHPACSVDGSFSFSLHPHVRQSSRRLGLQNRHLVSGRCCRRCEFRRNRPLVGAPFGSGHPKIRRLAHPERYQRNGTKYIKAPRNAAATMTAHKMMNLRFIIVVSPSWDSIWGF
jgi:hypothetical protein